MYFCEQRTSQWPEGHAFMFAVVYAKVIIKMETSKKTSTEIVKNYMRYLKLERNFSGNTLEAYRHDLDLPARLCSSEQYVCA